MFSSYTSSVEPHIPQSTKYLDISITNTTTPELLGQYQADLNQPLIEKDARGWDVAVVRASFPNSLIPLSLRDWSNNDFSITFSVGYNINDATCKYATVFMDPANITNGSKFIWSYEDWLQSVNTAIYSCYTQILALFPDGNWQLSLGGNPDMLLDYNTKLFSIQNLPYRKNGSGDAETEPDKIFYVWFNLKMSDKFPFPNIQVKTEFSERQYLPPIFQPLNVVPPNDYLLIVSDEGINQHSISLSLLSSLESIVVRTNLDVVSEASLNNDNSVNSQTQSFSNILTDFQPQTTIEGRDLNGYDFYADQNARCYQIVNNSPISKISVSFFWKSRSLIYTPIYIPYLSSINLKIRFRKIYDNRYITTN